MIKFFLKLLLASSLIYWLLHSGKMDLSLLTKSFENKSAWLVSLSILVVNVFLISLRWKKLLELKASSKRPFWGILKLTWIGNFFNTILPGAVSGDLIKVVYAKNMDKNLSKSFLLASVLIDRVIGLMSLFCLLGIFSLIKYSELTSLSPAVIKLVHFNFVLTAVMILGLLGFFFSMENQKFFLNLTKKIPFLQKIFHRSIFQLGAIKSFRKVTIQLIFLSMISQSLSILAFWLLTQPFFEFSALANGEFFHPITFGTAFTFIPLGFVSMSLPITPAGIGVGHAAFSTLFLSYGVKNGASLFNLYFLAALMVNLFGIIPYLMSGKKHALKEANEFNSGR